MGNQLQLDGTVDANRVMTALAEIINKTATGSPQGPMVHGPGGLFGVRGLSRDIVSTHTQFTGSLGEVLATSPSNETTPLFPYITGFVRSDTQEKNAICDDPEEAGQFKTCIQTAVFGRKEFKTRELEITASGKILNRGEFDDLQIVNSPLVNQMGGLMQSIYPNVTGDQALKAGRDMFMRMIEVAVAFQRWFTPQVFVGNPANSTAGGGYKEFMGLDLLISTTKIDALSGATCPSLYSDVKSFGYRTIDSTTDPDLYRVLSTMIYILQNKAKQQNLGPVELALVMRSQLFWEITRYWPQKYNTDGGNLTQAGLDNLYLENVRMRDAMRDGSYLLINSQRIRVIQDDSIPEENKAQAAAIPYNGGFASDIYIVPLSAMGGRMRTLYWQYFDFRQSTLPQLAGLPTWFWSDNGVFVWTMGAPKNWCLDATAQFQPRLILRTPQLAARLTDVSYVPLQHTDDPLPSQNYHVNGGVRTGRAGPSPFYEANLSGPGFTN